MTASTLPSPSAKSSAEVVPAERPTHTIRPVQHERFVAQPKGQRGVFVLASRADAGTISVELEAEGFGTLPLGCNDWGYDADQRELFVDPGLLVNGTVVRVQYAAP